MDCHLRSHESFSKWLLVCVFMLLFAYSDGKSENIGWSSNPYWSESMRNYNSGARYYMRHVTATTTDTFGYSFYRNRSFYHSGYGYRMYYPPSYYTPVYVGHSFYYYPPMFYYYYGFNKTYWDGRRPRYVCRNDNAFWPLENQTSEFVDGRLPALDLNKFDQNLSLLMDEPHNSPYSSNFLLHALRMSTGWTELNSLALNDSPLAGFDLNSTHLSTTTDRLWTQQTAMHVPPGEPNGRAILAYNYFACPDGKDPDEIYCCGSDSVQYCCRELVQTISWNTVVAVNMLTLVGIVAILMVAKYVGRCCHAPRATPVPVVETMQTAQYAPSAKSLTKLARPAPADTTTIAVPLQPESSTANCAT